MVPVLSPSNLIYASPIHSAIYIKNAQENLI